MYLSAAFGIGWATLIVFAYSFLQEKDTKELREFGMILLSVGFLLVIPNLLIEDQRIIQSVGLSIAAIVSLYISWNIAHERFEIHYTSRLITVTLSVFLLIYTLEFIQNRIIRMTAQDTVFLLSLTGAEAEVLIKAGNTYVTFPEASKPLKTQIVTACTGVGTISVFVGLISSFDNLSLQQKLGFSFFVASLIYTMNAIRNFFIAASYGYQLLHITPNLIELIFGKGDEWVSYYIADRIISQIGSIIVIMILGYFLMKRYDAGIIDEWIEISESTKSHVNSLKKR